jgi:hypothetical protein
VDGQRHNLRSSPQLHEDFEKAEEKKIHNRTGKHDGLLGNMAIQRRCDAGGCHLPCPSISALQSAKEMRIDKSDSKHPGGFSLPDE